MASVRKLPSGKYQARVTVDGKPKSIGTFKTKKEAQLAASKADERIINHQTLDDRQITFDEVAHKWLYEYKKKRLRGSTFENNEVAVRLHILPFFKGRKMLHIKIYDVEQFVEHLIEKRRPDGEKYEHETLEAILSKTKSIFYYAQHKLEVIQKNPADRMRVRKITDGAPVEKEVKYYTYEELTKILGFMQNYQHQRFPEYRFYLALMYFLSETGLRISEAAAISWDDLQGDLLTVERQVDTKKPVPSPYKPLKTESSYRTIKLSVELMEFLKEFMVIQRKCILKYSTFHKSADNLIFQNFKGNYVHPAVIRDTVKTYCEKAGLDYRGTHCFRHTHAVMLLEAGASPKFIADRLGHKSVKTTMDTYMHISAKMEEDELGKLASYKQRKNKVAKIWHATD